MKTKWYKRKDNRPILDPVKNPILRLAFISCRKKRIKLYEVLDKDTEEIKTIKYEHNFRKLLDEADVILNQLSQDNGHKGINKQYKRYAEFVKKGYYDEETL